MNGLKRISIGIFITALIATTSGCMRDMQDQPKYEPLEASNFFNNGMSSRTPVEGTVPRGGYREDGVLWTGKVDGKFAEKFPFKITKDILLRGKDRYEIFCSTCHGDVGYGDGMVVKRGFPEPPSYHEDRLVKVAPGYLFDVITNGLGKMYPYKNELSAEDRWAVVAYLKTLQESQMVAIKDLPSSIQKQIKSEKKPNETSVH